MADETSFSDVYAAITDAKQHLDESHTSKKTKQEDLKHVKKQIDALKVNDSKKGQEVQKALDGVDVTASSKKTTTQYSDLTKALIDYEQQVNKKDDSGEVKQLKDAIKGKDKDFTTAIKNKDQEKLKSLNSEVNSVWKNHESVIRNKDVGKYGEIEVGLMQMRVAIEKEPLDTSKVERAWNAFQSSINSADQTASSKDKGKYQPSQLNEQLDEVIRAIDNDQLDKADAALTQFVKIWPYVEGEIQTKNIGLYTQIENQIPYYQGILSEKTKDDVKQGLIELNKGIADTIQVQHYTSLDVMLIFLREGLEVLLIIMTLTTMTREMKDRRGTTSIISGAILGVLLSLGIALLFIHLLDETGVLRESIEAGLGIIAVVLMFIVGLWMHRRSSAARWNAMVEQIYQNAMQTNNLILLGVIGLITVLREGVEVIVFYLGMIGNITAWQFVSGIAYAVIILVIFGLLYRYIVKLIPLHYIFKVLTIILFIMTFKMLGMSMQKLQLLHMIPRHDLPGVPTLSWIGWYPTIESIGAQVVLLLAIGIYLMLANKKEQ